MIVVLPAPVAPTNATLPLGSTRKETSFRIQSSPWYANQTFSKTTEPFSLAGAAARLASHTLVSGSSTPGLVSISARKRSVEAIDDCITEYFADKSRRGKKKRRIQATKT